jgi:hypothetical protein
MPVSLVKLLDGHSIGDLATDLLSEELENETSALDSSPQLIRDHFNQESEPSSDCDLPAHISELPLEDIDRMLRELLSDESLQQVETITLNDAA